MKREKKPVGEMADDLDNRYGSDPIGSEIAEVLTETVKSGGYEPEEIESVKKLLWQELKSIRLERAS